MSDRPTEMAQFFNERADGYEEHMRSFVSKLYDVIASPIPATNEPISILDLGCGTGLEFEAVFARAPNALITGVDVSEKLLSCLKEKYRAYMKQIRLVHGPFEQMLSSKDENMTMYSRSWRYIISYPSQNPSYIARYGSH